MYILKNNNNLFVMQLGINDYSFTTQKEFAVKFLTRDGAEKFITKNIRLKNLKIYKY